MPRVELPELHDGVDGKRELFKLVNQIKRRFNVTGAQGTTIASAATLVPLGDGDYLHVTGTVPVDFIATVNMGDGDPLELYFVDGLTLNHASASPPEGTAALKLVGSVNAAMGAGTKIRLRADAVLVAFVEMSRGAA